jgi:carboxypeptidase C (cathepsin A)
MLAYILLLLAFVSPGQEPGGRQRQFPVQQPTATPQASTSPAVTPTGAPAGGQPGGQTGAGRRPQEQPTPPAEEPPVVTRHEIKVGGKTLRYTATVGLMPIKSREGEIEARMFFTAYTLDGISNSAQRPLTFSFNGGPGSASLWLHLGALGPRRVKMMPDGSMPPPPFQLVDNEQTWLDQTDLVFIDPVGTGYSRAARPDLGQRFFGLNGDIESVGEFIRMYLTRNERWTSPLFLAGESYGTTRASALSGYLVDRGIAFNGIVLISTVMNFETLQFAPGNDLPYMVILPSYASTAWYHKKLPPDLQSQPLHKVLSEVEQWAANDYAIALGKGESLTAPERQDVIAKLARYTGLDPHFIDNSNLRVSLQLFRKELLRSEKHTIGRLDSRFKGFDANFATDSPDFDASEAGIRPPFTANMNQYVRAELGYKTDLEYYALGGGIGPWNWNTNNGFVDTSTALRNALTKNPYLKVFVAMGYYDMATPYFAVQYTLNHINLDPGVRRNFTTGYYEAGHMMYIEEKSLARLRGDVEKFMQESLRK